jgi:hypothetical protein
MKKSVIFMKWLPRVLCILAILFIGMFSLDSFDPKLTIGDQLIGFLMHNIPTFMLIIFLVVAWKLELIGGIIFMILGIGLSPLVYNMNYHMNHSVAMSLGVIAMITFPFVVIGGLFVLSHYLQKKNG